MWTINGHLPKCHTWRSHASTTLWTQWPGTTIVCSVPHYCYTISIDWRSPLNCLESRLTRRLLTLSRTCHQSLKLSVSKQVLSTAIVFWMCIAIWVTRIYYMGNRKISSPSKLSPRLSQSGQSQPPSPTPHVHPKPKGKVNEKMKCVYIDKHIGLEVHNDEFGSIRAQQVLKGIKPHQGSFTYSFH